MTRAARPPPSIAISRRRCSPVARKRASMREGPLADLFRATEAAQRQADEPEAPAETVHEKTVEHVPTWEESVENVVPVSPPRAKAPEPEPEPEPAPPPPRKLEPVRDTPPAAKYVE